MNQDATMTSRSVIANMTPNIINDDEDCEVKALRSKLESIIIFTNKKPQIAKITNYASLERILPIICNSIFNMLSSKEREATYQRCLAVDLIEAGVKVEQEVDIPLMYKGAQVGSRRVDLVVTTPTDGKQIAIELKTVVSLNSSHLKQLQFYMHHIKLDIGFLINFPHIPEFPDVETTFTHELLQGVNTPLSDRSTRGKNAVATVQIVKVQSVPSSFTITATQQQEIIDAATTSTATVFVAPFTKRGTPCKKCTKQQALCNQHRS